MGKMDISDAGRIFGEDADRIQEWKDNFREFFTPGAASGEVHVNDLKILALIKKFKTDNNTSDETIRKALRNETGSRDGGVILSGDSGDSQAIERLISDLDLLKEDNIKMKKMPLKQW